ncbi:fibronectin type III domain-containing protein [Streptomyces sp. NPDC001070]
MNPNRSRPVAFATAVALAAGAGGLIMTPVTATAATGCASPVFTRQFFANTTLSGTPKKTDCDSVIDQNWGTGSPAAGLPVNNFSVRWSVTRDFGSGGPFSFAASSRDGIRVYLDGVRRIDLWKNVSTTVSRTVNVTVPSGKHTLRVDFVNWTGAANVKFAYTPRTSATVDKVKPLAPTGAAVAYDTATGKAKVTWGKNKEMDLAGYRVYRRLQGTSFGSGPLATTTLTSYTDTPPPTGQAYLYEVRAYDKAGNESAGTADQSVTTPDRTGPAAPAGLTVQGDLYGMVIGWSPVTDAAGYELYEKNPTTGAQTLVQRLTGTSYTDLAADLTVKHTYVVRAYDAAGNAGAYSAPVTADGVDRRPPDAPRNLRALPSRNNVLLTWSAPPIPTSDELDNGAHFAVVRSPGATLGTDAVPVECPDADTATATDSGDLSFHCYDTAWALDTTYTYGVTLTDGRGNRSAVSDPVTVTTADRTPPLPVTGLTATPRADGMVLRWNKPADDDIASYRGLVGVRQSDGTVKWGAGTPFGTCTDASDDPLAMLCIGRPNGETYVYTVWATDIWGNGLSPADPSIATVTATELDTTPSEPVGGDKGPLYSGGGWIDAEDVGVVNWRCEGAVCADITEYRVSRFDPQTRAYEPLHTEPAAAGTPLYAYLDETQPLGRISYYRVVGVLADGTETTATHPWVIRPDLL